MQLNEFLKQISREANANFDAVDDFARRCDTSAGQLRHVARGSRRAGESLAINIERESHGVVRCEDLRPDVDWGYIRGTQPGKQAA